MNNMINILSIATLTVSALAVSSTAQAQGSVRFNMETRGPGAGYNNTMVDRRVAQPRSILKGSAANRVVHNERRFLRRLGPNVRGDMRHRGDVARHARKSHQYKSTLRQTARAPGSRFDTRQLSPQVRQNMNRRGNLARQARANGSTRATSRSPRVRFNTTPRTRGAGYSASAPHNRVTKPKGILKNKNALRMAKNGKKLRTVGKIAAGGVVAAGGVYVAETALGVDIPDAFDAAEWGYHTLKDPRKAPQRIERLGRDSLRALHQAGRTLTNPKQMGRNLENGAKKAGRSIKKVGCSVGKLFGAKCR